MRTKASTAISSVAVVLAVSLGVFASASFATKGVVTQQSDLVNDDVGRLPSLRTSGSVKAIHTDGASAYSLNFTATFKLPSDSKNPMHEVNGVVPDLVMEQSISYPTLSGNEQFVGPVGLPFTSEKLALRITMRGDCFEGSEQKGYRLTGYDPKCVDATLALNGEGFDVGKLFMKLDSRVKATGRDGSTWTWRASATFEDPGYPFPIVSLGQGGATVVVVGGMAGVAEVDQVKFGGGG